MFKEINIPRPNLVNRAIEKLSSGETFSLELGSGEISSLLSSIFSEAVDSNPPVKARILMLDTKVEHGLLDVQSIVKVDFPLSADITANVKISTPGEAKRIIIDELSIVTTPHGKLSKIAVSAADPEKLVKKYIKEPHDILERYLKREAQKSGVNITEVSVSVTQNGKVSLVIQ